jgi:RTX calcium-binding nonapeptide repeat (4 copies)
MTHSRDAALFSAPYRVGQTSKRARSRGYAHYRRRRKKMRRIMVMVAMVSLLVGLFAVAAYAATFTCSTTPCYGTGGPDTIYERPGDKVPDTIYGRRGADDIFAYDGTDDVDVLYGNGGRDLLYTLDGDGLDTVRGQRGYDRCLIDPGDDASGCEEISYVD